MQDGAIDKSMPSRHSAFVQLRAINATRLFLVGFGCYMAAASASIALAESPSSAAVIWFPAGVAFAAALFGTSWSLAGVLAGSLAVGVWTTLARSGAITPQSAATIAALAATAVAQALLGAMLVRRNTAFPAPLARAKDLLFFFILGGPIACLPTSLCAAGALCLGGVIGMADFWRSWSRWWLGDSFGTIVVAVIALGLWGAPRQHWRQRLWLVVAPVVIVATLFTGLYWYLARAERGKLAERLQSLVRTTDEDIAAWFDNAKVALSEWRESVAKPLTQRQRTLAAGKLMAYHDLIWGAGCLSNAASPNRTIECWVTRDAPRGDLAAFDLRSSDLHGALARAALSGKAVAFPAGAGRPPFGLAHDIAVVLPVESLPAGGGAAAGPNRGRSAVCVIDMHVLVRKATKQLPPTIKREWSLEPFNPADVHRTPMTGVDQVRKTDDGCEVAIAAEFAGLGGWVRLSLADKHMAAEQPRYLDWLYLLGLLLAGMLGSHLWLMSAQTSELQDRIDERRRSELALAASEEKYRRLVETSHDLIWSVDDAGRWTFVNRKAAQAIYGLEPEQMLGRPFTDFQSSAQADVDRKVFAELAAGKAVFDYQTDHLRADGQAVHMSFNAISMFDEAGKFLGTTGTAQDVTQRLRAEAAQKAALCRRQKQSQALMTLWTGGLLEPGKLANALEQIAQVAAWTLDIDRVGVWLFDDDRKTLECRTLCERKPGMGGGAARLDVAQFPKYFQSLEGHRLIAAGDAANDPRTVELFAGRGEPGVVFSMLDVPIRLEEGVQGVLCHEHAGADARAWSVEDEDFACALADMVALAVEADRRLRAELERKRLEERLWEAQKMESLGVLAGGVAHDFNNLLTGILGYAELAQARLPVDDLSREYVREIETAGRRAADLCRQMLAYAGKGKTSIGAVDLAELVRETFALVRFSISKKAEVALDLAADLPPVLGDANQLRQVVMNLATNASDALDERAGKIRISLTLRTLDRLGLQNMLLGRDLPPGQYLCLEVHDTGQGMDNATKARIFEPFFTTKFTGRGLGLAAVIGIVRGHSGALDVQSEVGVGTSFRIWLPPANPATGRLARPADQKPLANAFAWTAATGPPRGTVLVVDDEPAVRRLAVDILQAAGFRTLEAADGAQAIERFESASESLDIRAVLLDWTMPAMDGHQTIQALHERAPALPVVVMSGYAESEAGPSFAAHSQTVFLQKPFTREQVVEKLAAVLRSEPA